MNYRVGIMLGRLLSGFQSDHGKVYHAVIQKKVKAHPCPFNEWGKKITYNESDVGLCGARPGRRSVGWSFTDKEATVTCPRCLAKVAKYV